MRKSIWRHLEHESPSLVSEEEMIRMRKFVNLYSETLELFSPTEPNRTRKKIEILKKFDSVRSN